MSLNGSGLEESRSSSAKMASVLRGAPDASFSSLSTTASFHGSGISDLRSAIVAQQRQLDTVVDKVAALMAAMHAEVIKDVRSASQQGGGEVRGCIEELRRAESDVDGRLAELRQSEAGLRTWLEGEVKSLHDKVHCDLHGSQEQLGMSFGSNLEVLGDRLARLEDAGFSSDGVPSWEAALQHTKSELHDHIRQGLHQESLQGPVVARLHALEEQVLEASLLNAIPSDAVEIAEYHERLRQLEAGAQRSQDTLQCMEEGIHRLARVGAVGDERQAQWSQWRVKTEGRIEQLASSGTADIESRLDRLEHWRTRSEESHPSRDPIRERVGSAEQRLDTMYEKMEGLAASFKETKRGAGGGTAAIEALGERVDSLTNTLQQETRRMQQRHSDAMRLGARVDATEAGLEGVHRELLDQRGEQRTLALKPLQSDALAHTESRMSQLQGLSQRLTEELRQDLQLQMTSLQGQTQRLMEELRQDLDAQRLQVQSFPERLVVELNEDLDVRAAQATKTAQRLVSELECELEPRIGQMLSASQRVVEELRQELDSRTSQMQSTSERLQDELRQDLEARCAQLRGGSDCVSDELRELQQDFEAQVSQTQSLQQDFEVQVAQTQSLRQELVSRSSQVSLVPKQLEEQMDVLRQGFEERLEARMTQCGSLSQRLMNELRQDLEAQLQQTHAVLQQMAQDIRHCSKDNERLQGGFDAVREVAENLQQGGGEEGGVGLAQLQGGIEHLAEEFSENKVEMGILREDVSKVFAEFGKDLDIFKDDIAETRSASLNARRLSEELQELVLQLKGRQDCITKNAVEIAREAVGEAVEALGERLEQDLAEPMARCDAGAADCERIVQEAFLKVAAMESQMTAIATDLRAQLAQEGGTLLEVLSAPSMRVDGGVEPAGAAAAAAREMLSGMSPARSLCGHDAAESTPRARVRAIGSRETAPSAPGADGLDALTRRLLQQEQALEELREWKVSFQGEIEGFLVDHRVSRSLAGLEQRSRSPQVRRNASTQQVHCGRRSYSMDSIRITGWN